MTVQNQNFSKMFADMLGAFPAEMPHVQKAIASQASLCGKLSDVAATGAEQSLELSVSWAKETFNQFEKVANTQGQPVEYARVMSDIASEQAKLAVSSLTAFSETVKTTHSQATEVLVQAGQEFLKDAGAAPQKPSSAKK